MTVSGCNRQLDAHFHRAVPLRRHVLDTWHNTTSGHNKLLSKKNSPIKTTTLLDVLASLKHDYYILLFCRNTVYSLSLGQEELLFLLLLYFIPFESFTDDIFSGSLFSCFVFMYCFAVIYFLQTVEQDNARKMNSIFIWTFSK